MQGITSDFSNILRGLKMTFDFNKIVFAFIGVIWSIIWILITLAFFSSYLNLIDVGPLEIINNVLFTPHHGLTNLIKVFITLAKTVSWAEYLVLIILIVGLLIIWSIIGGSITRLTALEFARNERIDFKESLSFALGKLWSYFWSPLIPALGILFFAACNFFGGFFGQIKYIGEIAVALGFPLAIISGFLIISIGIIGIIGFFLMFPTISAEGSDAFDAISRSYSYVIAKPKRFLSLFLGILICGTIFACFLCLIVCLVMQTSFYTVGFGMGQKFEAIKAVAIGGVGRSIEDKVTMASLGPWSMKFTAIMLMLYIVTFKAVAGGLVIAFAGTASTIAYFLLRKDVDDTAIDDVYIEEASKEAHNAEEGKTEEKEITQNEEIEEDPSGQKSDEPSTDVP